MNFTETQRRAIEFEGDGLIVAAAGSGKTAVLIEKIAWVVKKLPLSSLFITTFTEKAARELKKRLAKRLKLSPETLEEAFIGTFHGLGARLLRESTSGSDFTVLEDFLARLEQIYTARETLIRLLESNDSESLDLVEEYGFHRALTLLLQLLPDPECKFRYPTPLLQIRDSYGTKKQQRQVMDFNDLEIKTLQLLQDSALQEKWRHRFRYLFIDEFQDTSPLQWKIISRLHLEGINQLVLVGDPRQSIYRFRGADARLFDEIKGEMSRHGKIFYLNENFRSDPSIIQAVNQVNQSLFTDTQRLVACRPQELLNHQGECGLEVISLQPEEDMAALRQQEARAVVQRIVSLHNSGTAWDDMALLFRTRKSVPYFTDELQHHGIPFLTKSGESLLETAEVQATLRLMKIAAGATDPLTHLQAQLSAYGGKTLEDIYQLETVTFAPPFLEGLPPRESLAEWAPAFFEVCQGHYPAETSQILLKAFHQLVERLTSLGLTQLSELVRFLDDLQNEATHIPLPELDHPGVRLMTVHGAKGLEFPIVFLCDLNARPRSQSLLYLKLPDGQVILPERDASQTGLRDPLQKSELFQEEEKKQKQDDLEESKRLLYVAMTRAINRLILPLEISAKSDKKTGQLWSDWLRPYAFKK